jgi:hypothetical protein
MCLTGDVLISTVTIRLQDSMEFLQKICGKAAVSAWVILVDVGSYSPLVNPHI